MSADGIMHPTEASKRYAISDDPSFGIPYTLEYPLATADGVYKVVSPYNYDLFKTPGPGLQYVHGGASLQETVVPIQEPCNVRFLTVVCHYYEGGAFFASTQATT